MAHTVTHRFRGPEGTSPGYGMPDVGEIVAGPRDHWLVLEVRPIDSPKHPNLWRARMRPLGPHRLTGEQLQRTSWWTYERRG